MFYRDLQDEWETVPKTISKTGKVTYDWNEFGHSYIETWYALRVQAVEAFEKPDGANKKADDRLARKMAALHPVLHGQGKERGTKWASKREQFRLYLENIAKEQGKPINEYTKVLQWQSDEYERKLADWNRNKAKWIEENYHFDDYKHHWKKIYPSSWSKLGLPE